MPPPEPEGVGLGELALACAQQTSVWAIHKLGAESRLGPHNPIRQLLAATSVRWQRAWLAGRDAHRLQPAPDRSRRLGVATAKRQHAARDNLHRLGVSPGPPEQLMCRNRPPPFDALVVQGQRVPMRLRELGIGPQQVEPERPNPSVVLTADPQHTALGHRHGATRTADHPGQVEPEGVAWFKGPAPRKDPLARFEPGDQQVHPSLEVLGVHRTAVFHRYPTERTTIAGQIQ
jgi:hypothetical protein